MILVHMHLKSLVVACSLIIAACPVARSADLNFTVQQVGIDVVTTVNGFVVTAALTNFGASQWAGGMWLSNTNGSILINGPATSSSNNVNVYRGGIVGGQRFGAGALISASSGSGNFVGITSNTNSSLLLPFGYVSGSPITSSSIYTNKTISGLGLTLGTYNWSWGSGATAGTAQMTISNVPEPGTYALGAIATAVLAAVARRKRNQKTA